MSVVRQPAVPSLAAAWERFWFPAVPAARFEIFRRLLYGYLVLDVLVTTAWVRDHGSADAGLYQPLLIGRLLPLPVPTDAVVTVTMWTVLVGAVLGITGRSPRLIGAITACAYLQWMVIAFSYGKVNHDRFPLLVALFVAVTVGRTSIRDRTPSTAAGWALRMTMVATVAVYFLSVVAKVRYGGWLWANSATLTQALLRRATFLGRELRDLPHLAVLAQWAAVVFEVLSPLLLVRHRIRWVLWGTAIGFHVVTYAVLSIGFYPQLLCLLAFLPLERLVPVPQGATAETFGGEPAACAPPAPIGAQATAARV
ncbi:MAG TPA: HTTM domain-containing protein [Acidimicrobiales bacterium]|nr:HTTM domain-containing protein [Acidimicrobiales bacterium]